MTKPPEQPEDKSHEKHVQLGFEFDEVDDKREFIEPEDDPEAVESVWSDATTVEQYREDIELLADLGGL